MPLINCEVNLLLTWSTNCVVTNSTVEGQFSITEQNYIDGRNVFDQPINSMTKTYKNIRRIATGQGDDYTTGCLLDYSYFKENYKLIAIDLSKQQALDADPRAIQQINFTENFGRAGNTTMFLIIEQAKETVFEFSQGTVKVLWMQFHWMQFHQMQI